MGSYRIDATTIKAKRERDRDRYDKLAQSMADALNMSESEVLARQYNIYGVDNDFDLIEAMWDADRQSTGDLLSEPWFIDFRIRCAMNPEYTEKCLESRVFYDVKDEILRRLHRV